MNQEPGAGARFALAHERLAAGDEARSAYLDRLVRAEMAGARKKHTGKRKLSPEQVAEVRALRARGLKYAEIGARFGVSHEAVRDIILGRYYREAR